jgi:hypothetical protein
MLQVTLPKFCDVNVIPTDPELIDAGCTQPLSRLTIGSLDPLTTTTLVEEDGSVVACWVCALSPHQLLTVYQSVLVVE